MMESTTSRWPTVGWSESKLQEYAPEYAFAEAVGINVSQVRRYEGGRAQPTMSVLKELAVALRVSADELLFDETERGPDEDLRLQFEAVQTMSDEDRKVIASLIDAYVKKIRLEELAAS